MELKNNRKSMSDNAHCDGLPSEIYLHNGNADVLPPADFVVFDEFLSCDN